METRQFDIAKIYAPPMEFYIHKKLTIYSETPWEECFLGLIANPVFSLVWQQEESRTTDFGLGLMVLILIR